MVTRVLCVGGSDCSGAAGLQADVKTVTALGGVAATAVTAITVQDRHTVHESLLVDPFLVEKQLASALVDPGADAIKIGMLGSHATVELVARLCESKARSLPIVVDPVLRASSGRELISAEGMKAIIARLFPQAALVTPNIPEAAAITGVEIHGLDDLRRAADQFQLLGVGAVLIKGGHLEGDQVIDLLRTADGEERYFEAPRVDIDARGTGCTLASAIAVGLGEGMTLESAIGRAREYLRGALEAARAMPGGCATLNHGYRALATA